MNECLGWSGLGHCDGGDMGSGQMNVFCYVVDAAIAERVIVNDLKEHALLDGAVIAQRLKGLGMEPKCSGRTISQVRSQSSRKQLA
jgi:hypothetical protein